MAASEPLIEPPAAAPDRLERSVSSDRRLLSLSSLTVAARMLAKGSQLVFLIAAARLLTVDEFAAYSYLLVLAITFAMLGDTGVALAAGREVSAGRRTPTEAFWAAIPVVAIGAALAAATMVAFGLVGSGPGTTLGRLALAAGFVAANVFFALGTTMLRAVGRFRLEALLFGSSSLAFVVVAIGVAAAGWGLTAVLAVLCFKEVVSAGIAFVALRGEVRRRAVLRRWSWRGIVRMGLRMGIASIALAIATRCELIVLGNSADASSVAWFSAPLRLSDAVLVAALTAGYAVLPGTTYLAGADRRRAVRLTWRIVASLVVVGAGAGALAVLFAEPLITTLFGAKFSTAAGPARVVLGALPAYATLGVVWYGLLAFDAERALMRLAVGCAAVSLVAAVVAIPSAGELGAAWVYAAALTLMAVAGVVELRRATARDA